MYSSRITDKHRLFFVNDVLEFALFFDPNIKDKDKIVEEFLTSKDWIWYKDYFKVRVQNIQVSEDLREIKIATK